MATFPRLLLLAAALLLSACTTPSSSNTSGSGKGGLWNWSQAADQIKGDVYVKVVLKEQRAYVYRGKSEIGWSYVATGISKYPTPVGSFQVLERTADKHSNLYGKIYDAHGKVINSDAKSGRDPIPEGGRFVGAHMAYWMRISLDGLGLHVGPIPNPGHPASHGCIRLPRAAAQKIFDTVRVGTPVYIVQNAGDTPVKYVPKPTTRPAMAPAKLPSSGAKPQMHAPVESILPGVPGVPGVPVTPGT